MGYDVHIEGVTAEGHGIRFMTFGDYGRIQGVQGIQKLVNQFLKCLCTPKGTDLSDKNYGTVFMDMFLANIDSVAMQQMTVQSISDAEDQIRQFNTSNAAPRDERLFSAAMEHFSLDASTRSLELTVLLTNNAGTTVRLTVPLMAS